MPSRTVPCSTLRLRLEISRCEHRLARLRGLLERRTAKGRADVNDPICGKCHEVMTRENARLRPELFLHDDCLPDELRPPAANTDRELWRETPGDYYSPSIHVTAQGGIGINVGGTVIVRSVRDWHALATEANGTEVREAIERIRRVQAGERHRVVYGFEDEEMDDFNYRMLENAHTADLQTLADAYLALASPPPAGGEGDDGEALTDDWLRSIKFERVDGFPRPCLRRGSFLHICPPCGKLGWWLTLDVDFTEIRLPTPQVRGDVRRLLSALGMAHDRAADAPRRRAGEDSQS
jgi:hypothetical protein